MTDDQTDNQLRVKNIEIKTGKTLQSYKSDKKVTVKNKPNKSSARKADAPKCTHTVTEKDYYTHTTIKYLGRTYSKPRRIQ